MSITVGCDIESTSGCCGVRQITDFSDPDDDDYHSIKVKGKTVEEAYTNLFREITTNLKDHTSAAVVQIWFVKYCDCDGEPEADEYAAEPLRRLVEHHPGVLELGEYKNPNSGNYIKGYQWSVN